MLSTDFSFQLDIELRYNVNDWTRSESESELVGTMEVIETEQSANGNVNVDELPTKFACEEKRCLQINAALF